MIKLQIVIGIIPENMSEIVDPGQKTGNKQEGDRHEESAECPPGRPK
jgi:hypothetical protein